jgi:hypothetical protein
MLSWEAECAALRAADPKIRPAELPPQPAMRRCSTSDSTVEKLAMLLMPEVSRGLTVVRDEPAGLVLDMNKYAKGGGGDRQFYLQAYTGGAYPVDRMSRGSLLVPDLLLNVVGGIQPEVAGDIFAAGLDDGFAARFTSIWPDLTADWRHVDRTPNKAARDALDAVSDELASADWRLVLEVDDFKPTPFCRPGMEGQQLFAEWRADLMRALRVGEYEGRLGARLGKYPGLVARLGLVFHLIEWAAGRTRDPRTIAGGTVSRVLDLVDEYVLPMERRVYAQFAVTPVAAGGQRVARWLQRTRPPSFTARDVQRHDWSGLTTPGEVAAALDWLAAHRWVREADPASGPGRPANRYLVNPLIPEVRHG